MLIPSIGMFLTDFYHVPIFLVSIVVLFMSLGVDVFGGLARKNHRASREVLDLRLRSFIIYAAVLLIGMISYIPVGLLLGQLPAAWIVFGLVWVAGFIADFLLPVSKGAQIRL